MMPSLFDDDNTDKITLAQSYSGVSFTNGHRAANLADSTPASVPLPLRVEPKPKSGIR